MSSRRAGKGPPMGPLKSRYERTAAQEQGDPHNRDDHVSGVRGIVPIEAELAARPEVSSISAENSSLYELFSISFASAAIRHLLLSDLLKGGR